MLGLQVSILLAGHAALAAPLQEARQFGEAGSLSAAGTVSGALRAEDENDSLTNRVDVRLDPHATFFVAGNLGIEVDLFAGLHTRPGVVADGNGYTAKSTELGLGVGAAYNIWLAESLSILPSVVIAYLRQQQGQSFGFGNDMKWRGALSLGVRLPVLVHFGNAFAGLGVEYRHDLVAKDEDGVEELSRDFIWATSLGGWF